MEAPSGLDKGPGRKRLRLTSAAETARLETLVAAVCKHGLSETGISLLMGREESWLRGVLRGRARKKAGIAIEHALSIWEFLAAMAVVSIGSDVRTAGESPGVTRERERAQIRAAVRAARDFHAAMKLKGDDRLEALKRIRPYPSYPLHNRELAKIARLAAGELVKMRMCYSPRDLRIESRFKNPKLHQSDEPRHIATNTLQPEIDLQTAYGIVRKSHRLRCIRWARSGPALARMASDDAVRLWTYDWPFAHVVRIIRH